MDRTLLTTLPKSKEYSTFMFPYSSSNSINTQSQSSYGGSHDHQHHHLHHPYQHHHQQQLAPTQDMQNTNTITAAAAAANIIGMNNSSCHSTSRSSSEFCTEPGQRWASELLKECARAISDKDSAKIHHLLWMLNELASPYGDPDQKLASHFLQALFCKATESGHRCFKTLTSVAEKSHCFDSARKLILKFQEVSPWTTFGHVASNGAILEALDGEMKLHIIDISNTLCTQWPTLLESLATRNDETPHLRLTVVVTSNILRSMMKEIRQRMENFARLMGVPFEFNVITKLTKENLGVRDDEAIAVNCIGSLKKVGIDKRTDLIKLFKSLSPKIVTVVEEEADFSSSKDDFMKCFEECLRFYTLYFDMLEESFAATSNERLMLERECSRSLVRVLACEGDEEEEEEEEERMERGRQWSERFGKEGGFKGTGFSDDVVDDVKALLKRYRGGWSLVNNNNNNGGDNGGDDSSNSSSSSSCFSSGIYLAWKEEPVVWASAWKP